MVTPDGMGEDMHRERQNMKEARMGAHPPFTHDVVAVDSDGNVLYETESLYPNEVDGALDSYEDLEKPEGVDDFIIQERE